MIVDVRGMRTYVEAAGAGPPLVYLHGAAEWAGYSDTLVSHLAKDFRVIQPERRGHGRTPDVAGDLTFADMTADTIALIAATKLERPHLVGFSDGAIIAIEAVMTRPELIGKVVAIGPNVSVSGLTEEALAWLESVTPETWPGEAAQRHRELSPDGPDHWPVFAQKVIDMLRREPEIPLVELAKIHSPVLLIGADHDMIKLEHLVDIHRSIPGSQLGIIPGSSHELTIEQPDVVAMITLRFLAGDSRTIAE